MDEQFDIPILLIFFNRPETFEKVFEEVKKIKPKILFLAQDGPRNNYKNDKDNIEKCREIANQIDWECTVYKKYSKENLGCGLGPADAISWAFTHVTELIILEDDCVPAPTFFPFCKQMLEKYRYDQRICYISGLNHFEEWECNNSSYFFTKTGSIWGWATWKRSWDLYDYNLHNVNNTYFKENIKKQITDYYTSNIRYKKWEETYKDLSENKKLSYWDIQWGFVKYSQNMLVIVPKVNQILNIGIGENSTHAQKTKKKVYKKGKNFFFIPTHNLKFPLKDPIFCVCDIKYDNLVYRISRGNIMRLYFVKILKKLLRKDKK